MKSDVDNTDIPYSWGEDKPQIRREVVDSFHLGNDASPEKLFQWIKSAIQKAKRNGFTNVEMEIETDGGDENNLEHHYISIYGDRLENEKEFKQRIEHIRMRWLVEYEKFLRDLKMYGTEYGKARLREAKKAKKAGHLMTVIKKLEQAND